LARFGIGEHYKSLIDLNTAVAVDSSNPESCHMRAVVEHGLGMLRDAVKDYMVVVRAKPEHFAYYQKECALYYHHHMDKHRDTFNMDRDLSPLFKESWCKRIHKKHLTGYREQPTFNPAIPDVKYSSKPPSPEAKKLVEWTQDLAKLLHLRCPGYLSNRRQQRMAGLAALEIAQALRKMWRDGELKVPGEAGSGSRKEHNFGYRDMYDICIKWRQFSEPNDPVWWVDLLTPEQFAEGFGSHTPMVTGQTEVVRYFPEFKRSFGIMKSLIPKQHTISKTMEEQIKGERR